ncbi:hypothetical protein [Pseudonocardia oroxyli]|uniref:SnoaL-like domain-containing protein n=1 Tax=Pseudonocardia oroxyli TaxID=366584 RepID=A0A1G7TK32_PSEOR|nr:hypothetical protein [Pseudonocardia oroxyli]SDG35635.1 hypothetical protein SAMN05216377_11155 [Pseudonocardia oroxyli]
MSAFPPLSEVDEVRLALYRAVRERGDTEESNALELTTNAEVEITEGSARVTSIRLVLGGVPRDPHIVSGERVVDELVRAADGSWTVVRRNPPATS